MSIFIVPSDTFPDELRNRYVIKIPQLQQISVSINKMYRIGKNKPGASAYSFFWLLLFVRCFCKSMISF